MSVSLSVTLGGREGIPTLDRGGGTYLGWGEGYLSWMGGGVPTFDWGGVPALDREGVTYLRQVMPRAVRLLRLPARELSCSMRNSIGLESTFLGCYK